MTNKLVATPHYVIFSVLFLYQMQTRVNIQYTRAPDSKRKKKEGMRMTREGHSRPNYLLPLDRLMFKICGAYPNMTVARGVAWSRVMLTRMVVIILAV